MDLLEEIRCGFANLDQTGRMLPILALPASAGAWVFREDGAFGVAVEVPAGQIITERFSGAKMATVDRIIEGHSHRLLRLESSIQWLRNEFAVVCAQMVTPGDDGALRSELIDNPLSWWEKWRHLLGNAVVSRASYDTLAELLALEVLQKRGEKAVWRGPLGGSIDLDTTEAGYEVKSTLSRYESRIHIAGQFQLALSASKPLNLLHYRFEPTAAGDSINAVCDRLVIAGFDAAKLEAALSRSGLEAGCSARTETFKLLEARLFSVDDAFPRITSASFIGGTLPNGVIHIEYQVDLAGLRHEPF